MTDLEGRIVDATAQLAQPAPQAVPGWDVDQQKIAAMLGLDPRDPRSHAAVAVARRYQLDPLLGHVMVLPKGGRPYITRDGLLHIAHASGQLDGIDIDGPHWDEVRKEWVAQATVHRKDMSTGFRYPGHANDADTDRARMMAIARAERRALHRAFDVVAYDEPDVPEPAGAPEDPDKRERERLRRGFYGALTKLDIKDTEARRILASAILGRQLESWSKLTLEEQRMLVDTLQGIAGAEDPQVSLAEWLEARQ